jgi:hypothetical protein
MLAHLLIQTIRWARTARPARASHLDLARRAPAQNTSCASGAISALRRVDDALAVIRPTTARSKKRLEVDAVLRQRRRDGSGRYCPSIPVSDLIFAGHLRVCLRTPRIAWRQRRRVGGLDPGAPAERGERYRPRRAAGFPRPTARLCVWDEVGCRVQQFWRGKPPKIEYHVEWTMSMPSPSARLQTTDYPQRRAGIRKRIPRGTRGARVGAVR